MTNRLPHEDLAKIHGAAVSAHIVESREVLLTGISPSLTGAIPVAGNPSAQILADLSYLNDVELTPEALGREGAVPLARWLQNAMVLTRDRKEEALFDEMCTSVSGPVSLRRVSTWPRLLQYRRQYTVARLVFLVCFAAAGFLGGYTLRGARCDDLRDSLLQQIHTDIDRLESALLPMRQAGHYDDRTVFNAQLQIMTKELGEMKQRYEKQAPPR